MYKPSLNFLHFNRWLRYNPFLNNFISPLNCRSIKIYRFATSKQILMKLSILSCLCAWLLLQTTFTKAQTTAMDFYMDDCNGSMHHLYSELDPDNVIIMEFFMTCSSCVTAGHQIE